jgi:hypothetical protein
MNVGWPKRGKFIRELMRTGNYDQAEGTHTTVETKTHRYGNIWK